MLTSTREVDIVGGNTFGLIQALETRGTRDALYNQQTVDLTRQLIGRTIGNGDLSIVPPTQWAAEKINVLLVDDEPKNLVALDAALETLDREQLNLVHASSGADALRCLLKHDYAVILLDVHMPVLDGFETAALIRQRERSRDIPIIFLTAANRDETFVSRGYSLGAVDYLVKPFNVEVLRSKVAVFVELFKKTRAIKRQAAQLAEATELLNSVLESSTGYAITALDLDGTFLAWNEGARRLYGYSAEEMVGRQRLHALSALACAPDDTTQGDTTPDSTLPDNATSGNVQQLLDTALSDGRVEVETEWLHKDGHRLFVSVTIAQRRNAEGQSVGFVSISHDITERLLAEAERAQLIVEQAARAEAEAARDRLQQIMDVLPEAVLIADAAGRVVLGNAAAREIIGELPVGLGERTRGQGGKRRRRQLRALHLDGQPYQPDAFPLLRSVRHGEVVRGEQLLLSNSQTDQDVPVLVNSAPLQEPDGTITGGVAVFQDITALKDLEREKDAFLAAASHDLKNPLTAIKSRAQILERRLSRLEQPELASAIEGLQRIDQTANRLVGMINELLDVTRLQMGRRLDLECKPTDLVALVNEVVSELRPTAQRHELAVQADPPEIFGEWDAMRLERVLTNLVSNAIKFSPNGGSISIEASIVPDHEPCVGKEPDSTPGPGEAGATNESRGADAASVAQERVGTGGAAWAVVRVRDQGVGIPKEDLPRIFERFFRASNVTRRIEGTGIGLSGARHIIEQHGGQITVESEESNGSTFTVRLPLTRACNDA